MRPRSALFPFQKLFAERLVEKRQAMLLVELGYGKTATTLTALVDNDQWPVLVVAPQRVAKNVWHKEAAEWEHTSNLVVTPLVGSPSSRRRLLSERLSHVETVSYENLLWLSETVCLNSRYRCVVFDELSKMKDAGTKRFRRLRSGGKGLMEIPFRVGLTGTPVGNHLLDLWGESYMTVGEKALGPTFSGYRDRYFSSDYMGFKWTPREGAEREIQERLRPFALSIGPQPEVKVPGIHVNVVQVDLPARVVEMGKELETQLWTSLANGQELEALSKGTAAMKLRQLASGAAYTHDDVWEAVHDEKLDALDEALDELQGEPALVCYWFKHELERIQARLTARKRTFNTPSPAGIERWNARKLDVLLVHPQSAGHGLNLQAGGHNIIWYTLPWSGELWKQTNGRLARVGQKSALVNAHVLLAGKADAAVLGVLRGKGATEASLLAALQA